MPELAITAVGRDRPGIVAGLTEALLPIGANLHDCRAALLHGMFAMVMAVEVPGDDARARVDAAIAPVAKRLELDIRVVPASDTVDVRAGDRCVISVYGADHPGIVHAVSNELAALAVNIVDLSSRVVGDPPVYVLGIAAELPPDVDVRAVHSRLAPVGASQRVEVHVELEADEVI